MKIGRNRNRVFHIYCLLKLPNQLSNTRFYKGFPRIQLKSELRIQYSSKSPNYQKSFNLPGAHDVFRCSCEINANIKSILCKERTLLKQSVPGSKSFINVGTDCSRGSELFFHLVQCRLSCVMRGVLLWIGRSNNGHNAVHVVA